MAGSLCWWLAVSSSLSVLYLLRIHVSWIDEPSQCFLWVFSWWLQRFQHTLSSCQYYHKCWILQLSMPSLPSCHQNQSTPTPSPWWIFPSASQVPTTDCQWSTPPSWVPHTTTISSQHHSHSTSHSETHPVCRKSPCKTWCHSSTSQSQEGSHSSTSSSPSTLQCS